MDLAHSMQNWLQNFYSIKVSSEWLAACLEWIEQENKNTGNVQSVENLQCLIFEQWLMSDLSEIGESLLPTSIASTDNVELTQNYPLQIISCIDVGSSLFSQLQKFEGQKAEYDELSDNKKPWTAKPSRMLMLSLTDGHTQIKAMEYQPIQILNDPLPYGLKVLLHGPLKCRRGIILLTPQNIHILGGEVETTEEDHKPQVVIQKSMLNNRENGDNSARCEFSGTFLVQNKKPQSDNSISKEKMSKSCSNTSSFSKKTATALSSLMKRENPLEHSNSNIKVESKETKPLIRNDDEWHDDTDYSLLLEDEFNYNETEEIKEEKDVIYIGQTSTTSSGVLKETQSQNSNLAKGISGSQTIQFQAKMNSYFNSVGRESQGIHNKQGQLTSNLKRSHKSLTHKSSLSQSKLKLVDNSKSRYSTSPGSTHLLNNRSPMQSSASTKTISNSVESLSSHHAANEKRLKLAVQEPVFKSVHEEKYIPQAVVRPIDLQAQQHKDLVQLPYQYLSTINTLMPPTTLTVKAYISTLTEKLSCGNGDRWTLACRINDGTASIDVDLDDKVLTELIGFSAHTSVQMKQEMKTHPKIKEDLMQGLSQCQQKLINMSCLMELKIFSFYSKPVVTKLLIPSSEHIYELLKKLSKHL
ncbi:recQ-mediated genome instability protein 1 [Biomphalaria glabrata]|nr:recQ-mediated genome instability protein 1-like isoform X3 [Biomphalaria glabrata]XP_055887415.1 recQ-mediated genome instability protein 1-like isoform X3 [Biomphalaria glabrata]XP_055887416.1 recQ-mediated genome instability protein 1-like isoform X3 [Biomphalaria glabrata]KAI8758284.1 recQ-mediated genome instability protein 1-like [Biomphalaria glabrata]KAI8791790.1 recQ-mediated genome instability protein 1 [Biomphalaria glabrata]